MTTFNALNRFGSVVRSFGCRDAAEAYRDRMAAIGSIITIEEVWLWKAA